MSPQPWANIQAKTDAALMAQYGEPVIVGLRSAGVYNPNTGTSSAAVYTSANVTGIVDAVTRKDILVSGGAYRRGDVRVMLRVADLPRAVAIGDRVTVAGLAREVVAIEEENYSGAVAVQHVIARSV